jgi:opacity protein-like surface antigen
MGTKYWSGAGVLASIVAGVGAASAADLPVKAPVYKAPPPVILSDWAGFYLGINGGYGWGNTTFDSNPFDNPIGFLNTNPKGGLFGGHAGYNWQYGKVVAGVEVDFDGAGIKSSDTILTGPALIVQGNTLVVSTFNNSQSVKFDELATARARLGYALLPDLLAYGTAGAAWGHSTLNLTETIGSTVEASTDANADHFGWAAGAGLEYHLGHGFIVRGEYLHYDFVKNTYSFPDSNPAFGANAASTIDVVRGGLSYKF